MDGIFVRRIIQKVRPGSAGIAIQTLLIVLLSTGCASVFHQQTQPKQRFSNASLKSNYTYNLAGMIFGLPKGYNLYHESGAFVADGNGGITGIDDFSSGSTPSNTSFTGSYSISGDGTGTMTFSVGGRQIQLAITMRSNAEIYLLEYDSFATGTGGAVAQTAISTPLSGTYVFRLYTHTVGGPSSAVVGRMTVSGTQITGDEDVAQIGTSSSLTITGTLTSPDSNGRGTLTLTDDNGNASHYVYYVIDSHTLNFIRTDTGFVGEGRVAAQTGTFGSASIQGSFVFHLGGDTLASLGGINSIGVFTGDGSGNITSGSRDSAVDGDTTNQSFAGTYTIDSRGRATISVTSSGTSPISQVAWMADSTQGFFLQEDQNTVGAGGVISQQSGSFSASSVNGEYVVRMIGFDAVMPPTVGRVGVMTFDGNATVTFADLFVNRGGVQSQLTGLSGSYTVSSNGRVATGTIKGVANTIVFYLISNTSAYFLIADSGSEIPGQNASQVPQ